jgi:serine protease Do
LPHAFIYQRSFVMRFNSTTAALTILAAAIGTALFSLIQPVQADIKAEAEAEAAPVMAIEATYAPPQAVGTGGMALPDFRAIVRTNVDAIVKIEVVQKAREMSMEDGEQSDPMQDFLRRFGGPGMGNPRGMRQPEQQGMGSGFIISSDGEILTNAHVVKGADEVTVRLNDQREFKAKVMGLDERTDVALIKIDAKALPVVQLGNSDGLEVGEWVLAIGAPFGLDYSATQGIVSATGRELPNENFVPFIQTDAAVNPGNSGGPLFNTQGQVIGINSQIYSRSGGYMGLSFAIPIKTAMGVAKQLESKGFVERGWLGVVIQEMSPQLAKQFGMDKPKGALVGDIAPDSPALAAGLETGDVILSFDGKPVKNSRDLPPIVAATPIGDSAKVEVLRGGKIQFLNVKVGKLKEDQVAVNTPAMRKDESALDLVVSDLTAAQRDQLGIKQGGALVTDVKPGPAAEAGVREGDVVLEVNRNKISDAQSFSALVKKQPKDESTLLLIRRDGGSIFVVVEPA